jgi:AcrR family transcriptional regulator
MTQKPGRTAQKERTRKAILDGARTLLSEGKPVTVAAAAEQHSISKATAYRYFSDAALLVAEAGLDISVAPYEEIIADLPDTRQRLKAISLYFFDLAIKHEAGFRQFVGMTLLAWAPDATKHASRRGGRRISMYERALADDDAGLAPQKREILIRALSTATGTEAMIALLDIANVDNDTARETVSEIADAILDRYLGQKS